MPKDSMNSVLFEILWHGGFLKSCTLIYSLLLIHKTSSNFYYKSHPLQY